MTDTQSTTVVAEPRIIAASKLEKSPLNVRRTPATLGMEELKASLLAHGLMQNLVVTEAKRGAYRVIAGGRRLEAIHSLQSEGKLPQDFAVPCQVVSEEHAVELSLAENTVRLAMHPADQFEAFAALIEKGESAADVARRFGVEESLVLKRMKLARVAPELLKAYRDDRLTLECLMAFTITDDRRKQLKVFKSLQDWQTDDPGAIRGALTEQMVESSGKLARFVGIEAYKAAGGSVRADLFGDDVYLENPKLLQRLVNEKIDAIRKELEAEGWSWIEFAAERDFEILSGCSRIQPRLINPPAELVELKSRLEQEQNAVEEALEDSDSDETLERQHEALCSRLREVEEQIAGFAGFDDVLKRLAGCFVSIAGDGTPVIDRGLVKPESKKLLAKLLKSEDGEDGAVRPKPKDGLAESLRRDLAADRLQAAQVAIATHPDTALDILTFHAVNAVVGRQRLTDGPKVEFVQGRGKSVDGKPSIADRSLADIRRALPTGWLKGETEAERFETFRSLPDAARRSLLAYCVAMTLQPKLGPADAEEITAYDVALSLTGICVADYWRPAKDSFLSRVNREQLLSIGREVLGEQWAQSRGGEKKALLVDQLDRAFANPAKSGRTPEQIARLKNWLPQGMAFDLAAAPKPATTKKVRKAA
jgi:ParB family chromosome partitioning protein